MRSLTQHKKLPNETEEFQGRNFPAIVASHALAGLLREALEKFVVDRVKSAIAEDDDDVA
jgi:hypothetical protein